MSYRVTDWEAQDRAARTPGWKRALYRVARPLIDLEGRRHLSAAALARWCPELVFARRGFPLEERRQFATAGQGLAGKTVLVQGTGTGWDVMSWAELRPAKIVATDAFAFPESWEAIARAARDRHGVPVEFRAAPLEDHAFLAAGSVDLCASDAVLEHVRDVPAMLAESRRVLRSTGRLYAGFGPLWYAPGGDHFAPRAGLDHVYAHIEYAPDAYRAFFERHRQPVEDFQSGGRYVELDLFSKLRADDYLAAFRAAGFRVDALVAEVCPLALAFEAAHPARVAALLAAHQGRLDRDDLRLKALLVRLAPAA